VPLILDTCAAIWIVSNADLAQEAVDALDRARDDREAVYVSPITAWEIGLLAAKGRFASPHSPKVWFSRLMAIESLRLAELSTSMLIESCFLPGRPPRDPGDRIILATARELDLTIVTRDSAILAYANDGQVRVIAC
jgi:PIN domain nuclease of toxin-antitoxin system